MANKQIELMGATKCAKCKDKIGVGEYRVVVMLSEMDPKDYDEGSAAGTIAGAFSFCDTCIAEMPTIEIGNPWKLRSDSLANPSAGPGSEDFSWRAKSSQGIAADKVERSEGAAGDEGGDEGTGADFEANLNSTDTSDTSWLESASEDDLRDRMSAFLETPESRKMGKTMRTIANKWASGETQNQIATAVGVNQGTVSRWIAEAKTWLYKKHNLSRGAGG